MHMRMSAAGRTVLGRLLTAPGAEWYGLQIAAGTGVSSGTLYPILRRLEAAGWLTSRWEDTAASRPGGRPPRRYYRFTADGAGQARAVLAAAERRRPRAAVPWPAGG